MEKRGQGALEYLLLIGGAVLIAVIVIAVVTGLTNTSGNTVNTGAQCAAYQGYATCIANTNCLAYKADGTAATEAANFGYCRSK